MRSAGSPSHDTTQNPDIKKNLFFSSIHFFNFHQKNIAENLKKKRENFDKITRAGEMRFNEVGIFLEI